MTNLLILSFLFIALSSFILAIKKLIKTQNFVSFLFVILSLILSVLAFEVETQGVKIITILIAFLGINFLISQVIKSKIKILLGLSSLLIFGFLYKLNVNFSTQNLIFDFKNLLILPIFAVLFPLIIKLKLSFFSKYFPENNLAQGFNLIGIGMLLAISLFFGGIFGALFCASIYFIAELYINKSSSLSFLPFVTSGVLMLIVNQSTLNMEVFFHSSTLLGVFLGAGIGLLFSKLNPESPPKIVIFIFVISLLLTLFAINIELLKEHLGGISAFSALLLVFVLTSSPKNNLLNISFISLAVTLIFIEIPYLKPESQKVEINEKFTKFQKPEESNKNFEKTVKDSLKTNPEIAKEIQYSEIIGKWKIISAASKIDFELGPTDARTKGIFKAVEGDFVFAENVENSKITVNVPLSGFSTFNSFRDEGLIGPEYLDAEKFPNLYFKAKSVSKIKSAYSTIGQLEMKGIKQNNTLVFNILELGSDKKGTYLLISGKSKIDRSKHNMESDPKIGDLVDFSFQLELRK